ncbi:MAG: cytochrome P450 [Dehalococcoidia bacterium]
MQYNPVAPDMRDNPYPFYKQLREQDPVHWSELIEAWLLTRYDDVISVLRSPDFSADRTQANNRFTQEMMERQDQSLVARATTMLGADPPEHTRLRNLVSKAFAARTVEAMRPHIQDIAVELLDAADPKDFDLIRDLATPMPVIVIAEMLGVPAERRADFKHWSDDIVASLGALSSPDVVERAQAAAQDMAEYFAGVIEERRQNLGDDLISGLIAAEERGDVLSTEEMIATCILLLAAGNETTTNLIGNGMLALARKPDQLQLLTSDFSLIESAVEEFLRYDGTVQSTARVATKPLEIEGRKIEPGQLVMTSLAAANHDPAQFDNPDELDITRQDNRHVALGFGIHFCLGAPLARIEAQTAFRELLSRWPNPQLVSNEVDWNPSFILRGPKSLPLNLEA